MENTYPHILLGLKLRLVGYPAAPVFHKAHYKTGWGRVTTYGHGGVAIDRVTARIKRHRGLRTLAVCDTPHFAYAMRHLGDQSYEKQPYIDYISGYFPENDLTKRLVDFDWIIENYPTMISGEERGFDMDIGVLLRPQLVPKRRLILLDGLHRCSAALAAGRVKITASFSL